MPPSTSRADFDDTARRLERVIGERYHIERPIGRGGMALVFLAQDLRHHRAVAIKVLLAEIAPVLGPDRFLREIQIAAQLSHPHIVPLYDSGEADGLLYYVMPYVEGASLRHRVAGTGGLPIAEVVQTAREVADALAYAHELGVIHRDIKPENILLTHSHAVVADFGVARALHATASAFPGTTGGITLGTPHYMSPEQAESDALLDHRTDIYALGCTIYEMLTGRPPFTGPGTVAILAQHLREPVPLPSALRPDVPRELDRVVQRAMAKTPDDRYATAAELSAALAPFASSTAPVVRRAPTLHRWRAAALIGALSMVAGVAVWIAQRPPRVPIAARRLLHVVVPPFATRDTALRLTADRMTEALTNVLAIPALSVTGAAAVADLHDAPLDTLRVRFNPDRFVSGRIDAAGPDSLRVAVQILEPRTGRALSQAYALVVSHHASIAAAADTLSLFVRHALWSEIERDSRRARVRDSATAELVEAARGQADAAEGAVLFRLDQSGFRALALAESLLHVAQRRDSRSDLIPVELARVANARAFYVEYLQQVLPALPAGLPSQSSERRRALAMLEALIARRRGPADAFELRGAVLEGLYRELYADSLLDAAIASYRSATELDVHRASAWKALAAAQRNAAQYADALLSVQRSFEEDVFSLYQVELLRSQFDAALRLPRLEVAKAACRRGLAVAPLDTRIADCEMMLWSRTSGDARMAAAARAHADSLAAANGDAATLMGTLRELYIAEIYARADDGERADAIAKRATASTPAGWRPLVHLELAYLRLLRHDADSAVALIADAVRRNPINRRTVPALPWFAPLRSHGSYAAMLRP